MAADEERQEPKQVEQESDHRAEIVAGSEPTDQPLNRRARFWRRTGSNAHSSAVGRAAVFPAIVQNTRNPDILNFSMTTMTIQVRGRGTLTLPASLREKYRLGEGDPLTVVDLDGAVLLSPRVLVVPRLAAEMERLRRARKLSLKDLGGPARED